MNGCRLLKDSGLQLILVGATLERCSKWMILSTALVAEVTLSARELVPSRPARTLLAVILLALFSNYVLAQSGADIYKARCSPCHGRTGAGDTMIGRNLKLRPLGSDEVQKQTDEELFTIISKGKDKMPAFDHKLSKDQIDDVLRYVRSLKK
jgi:mono/diheme cytochrome c family protein